MPARQLAGLVQLGRESGATFAAIDKGKRGLLYLDGRLARVLSGRQHGSCGPEGVNTAHYRSPRASRSVGAPWNRCSREMQGYGVRVSEIAFKDIILPGDIRERNPQPGGDG